MCLKRWNLIPSMHADAMPVPMQLLRAEPKDLPAQHPRHSQAGVRAACITAQYSLWQLHGLLMCFSLGDGWSLSWHVQLWLLALMVVMARASAPARLMLTAGLAGLTAAALPARLWRPQLTRLGTLALVLFTFTAIGAGDIGAHVPPCTSSQHLFTLEAISAHFLAYDRACMRAMICAI